MKKLIVYSGIVASLLFTTANVAKAQVSDQGKGAIIGGAGGAVVGGLIGHNVGGALIGAGIGAGDSVMGPPGTHSKSWNDCPWRSR